MDNTENIINRPAAVERDLRTYANSGDPDQTAHSRSLVWIFAVSLHNIVIYLDIRQLAKVV